MGGWPYQYVVPYQENLQAALDGLRKDVFERGAYYGSEARPRTIKEAVKLSGESGTRSILDIERITKAPASCCAAPLTHDEIARYFGGQTPTIKMIEECEDLWEDLERGTARCVVIQEGTGPKELVFIGYSFD
jgi:hypothetical protein